MRWKKYQDKLWINKIMGKINLNNVNCVIYFSSSFIVRLSRSLMLFWILSETFADKILILHDFGGASAFLDHFLVLFLSAFGRLPRFIAKFFLRLLTTISSSWLVHFFKVLDWESLNFFGGVVLKVNNFVGGSGRPLILHFRVGLFV